ncbi:MAG: penicillin acylase family protein [Rubrivivax sp.]|nr:penicillin acylase family protein [Rubrivivax sp.]
MSTILKTLAALLALLVAVAAAAFVWLRSTNAPQVEGELQLAGLSAPVRVLRDEIGVPYIFAANTPDLLRAQGFVTAQHRLMQLELFRATWRGELSAALGEVTLPSDIRMRVLGIRRNGDRHAALLGAESRAFFQHYVDGVNAYVADHANDHPLELKAVGLVPRAWSVADLVALVHFIHYSHATNFKAEVVAQKLIDQLGVDRAREIFPLTLNPDAAAARTAAAGPGGAAAPVTALGVDWGTLLVAPDTLDHQGLGSNNWAVGPSRSASGRAMVANDPHLDNRILPGTWHPVGLFAPGIQAVGAALPGMPGILVGRTQHVAFGVTNAYGDVQDLYVETVDPTDPNRYLDGDTSQPFGEVTETIRVKDKAAPGGFREQPLKLRFTKRGPVISDHPGLGPKGNQLLVLRSTDAEVLPMARGLPAPDAAAFDRELQRSTS